jgi:hypothetical protein
MDYRGTYEDGVIRPDGPVDLPDGTPVEFQPLPRNWNTMDPIEKADYMARNPKTLDQIIREQGIKPIKSLDELGGEWPDGEDDTDDFIKWTKELRD